LLKDSCLAEGIDLIGNKKKMLTFNIMLM